jgi:hypothetical protein
MSNRESEMQREKIILKKLYTYICYILIKISYIVYLLLLGNCENNHDFFFFFHFLCFL